MGGIGAVGVVEADNADAACTPQAVASFGWGRGGGRSIGAEVGRWCGAKKQQGIERPLVSKLTHMHHR